MKTKTKAMILAGVFAMTATFPVTALARRGGAAGSKGMQVQTQRNDSQTRKQLRLRAGKNTVPGNEPWPLQKSLAKKEN